MKLLFSILCSTILSTLSVSANCSKHAEDFFLRTKMIVANIDSLQDSIQVSFPYCNRSKKKLTFTGFRTSCDCVTINSSLNSVLPSESGNLIVGIDLKDTRGSFIRRILIYTDRLSPILLTIKGNKL